LRVVVGVVFLAHGWQSCFTLGFHGVAGFFGGAGIPLPLVSAVIVTLVEFLGGIALIVGFLTRWAAALNGFDMVVADPRSSPQEWFSQARRFRAPIDFAGRVRGSGDAWIRLAVCGWGAGQAGVGPNSGSGLTDAEVLGDLPCLPRLASWRRPSVGVFCPARSFDRPA